MKFYLCFLYKVCNYLTVLFGLLSDSTSCVLLQEVSKCDGEYRHQNLFIGFLRIFFIIILTHFPPSTDLIPRRGRRRQTSICVLKYYYLVNPCLENWQESFSCMQFVQYFWNPRKQVNFFFLMTSILSIYVNQNIINMYVCLWVCMNARVVR